MLTYLASLPSFFDAVINLAFFAAGFYATFMIRGYQVE